ncbi:UDPglucose 6-dehydrogenase [Breznakibacter xylanolyticus]|uniref:UDP-glucose 6-dehydrogenase n=1 Tax=Breznakibacter xylanolyticus TaxID=990 RepID=A0A2W7ND63_9BACT|nr:UDP-glucose/GDP-mannose dehydrogenase family protein [Breznakibacter xylanolyticus]MBN2743461.1 UDP-glucose/GDP-mannose dehydrogenase family protein [Marinilabiliaceae bacterium]PZX17910.1 UDPglucose 6-dehydrogenase [Breznakibacter xylanolyticus]
MKIAVVGTGYVGLVTGTCFAETGINVTCVDIDETKISKLKSGIIPIYEPGLDQLVLQNVEKGRLHFTTNVRESIEQSELVFIAVGTPPGEDGSADLRHVLEVARQVGRFMTNYLVVVTKSTVPIGTAVKVKAAIQDELQKRGVELDFDVASNPEFLKEGNAIDDFMKPDRIVVGTETEQAQKVLSKLYKPFTLNGHPILFMDVPSAEMTKYAANAMLATKISFINDIANLCELVGADISMVRQGIGSDARIGNKFIYAGAGYGGSCFPKDVKAIIKTAESYGYRLRLLEAVDNINEDQKKILVKKISQHFKNHLEGKTFAVWGLSFKPHTDDMREAPSVVIIKKLIKAGAKVKVYDPVAMHEAQKVFGNTIEYGKDPYDVLIDADALVLITEWPEFRILNYKILEKLLKNKVVFDGRNIYDMAEMTENGFDYYGIGRTNVKED